MRPWKITSQTQCKALEQICALVQNHVPYNLVCSPESDPAYNEIFVAVDNAMEGYEIRVLPAQGECQTISIRGADPVQLLYAASDLRNKYVPFAEDLHDLAPHYFFSPLFTEPMKPWYYRGIPRLKRRGLWTWGHVIRDYQKYIDNMVTLKLNTLIVWNDFVPVNIRQIIDYAHENGVSIYLGYAWGWDTGNRIRDKILDVEKTIERVVETYRQHYALLDCDGIYFQSFTEVKTDSIHGRSVAETVVDLVNRAAERIFAISPDLELLFGLHATSVKTKLDVIAQVDPRISIVWEDAGAFPYAYLPSQTDGFPETQLLNRQLQNLRNGGFGVVLKGVCALDWLTFRHQEGPYMMGVSPEETLKKTAESRRKILRYLQAYWLKAAPQALALIRDFDENAMVTVLVEDCAFESLINFPTALYSQFLWDSDRPIDEIMCETARMPDVTMV